MIVSPVVVSKASVIPRFDRKREESIPVKRPLFFLELLFQINIFKDEILFKKTEKLYKYDLLVKF